MKKCDPIVTREKKTPSPGFSDAWIRTREAGDRRQEFKDGDFKVNGSLALRVTRGSRKTFSYLYRNLAGRQRRATLGEYPAVSLAEARKRARELAARVALGEDPADDKRKKKEAARQVLTFGELAELYLRDHAGRHKSAKSQREDKRMLEKDLLPVWRNRPVKAVRRGDIVKVLDGIVARGAPVAANRTKALVHTIFAFAIQKSYLPADTLNPCANVAQPGGKEKGRERVLTDEEIKAVWEALESFEEPMASLYRLILLTAARSGEVKAMRWEEIRDDLWIIPPERTKNGLEHRVPLSAKAQACLDALRAARGESGFVFPSRFKAVEHVKSLKKQTRKLQEAAQVDSFTPHDLRRTAATGLSRLGVDDTVIAKILNHKWADRHITSVYNRWQKLPEMRRALERWSGEVERIASGQAGKVVRFG